jgi:hypothetical protein
MLRLALPVQNLTVDLNGGAAGLLLLLEPKQLILQQQAASGLAASGEWRRRQERVPHNSLGASLGPLGALPRLA